MSRANTLFGELRVRMIPLLPDVAAEAGTFAALLVVGGIGMTYLLSLHLLPLVFDSDVAITVTP